MIIFDLDGTLLNTIDDLGMACNHALRHFGFPTHTLDEYKHLVGNGVAKLIERSLPSEHRHPDTVEQLRQVFVPYYDRHCCEHTHPYEGMNELVNTLIARNLPVAVASNKYQAAAEAIVHHYFPVSLRVYGQRDGMPIKPDPAIVNQIRHDFCRQDETTLFVGDSAVDILTAKNANAVSIGVCWGFRGRTELENAQADYVVDTAGQLMQTLMSLADFK